MIERIIVVDADATTDEGIQVRVPASLPPTWLTPPIPATWPRPGER
jgi:hypothetical protein